MKKTADISPYAVSAAIAACAVLGAGLGFWLWQRFGSATYVRLNTMFGRTRIYEVADDNGDPVRLLEVDGIVQSGTYTDERYANLVFEYLKRYDVMFEDAHPALRAHPIKRVLVLGCGGYDYPKHLIAHHPDVVVDAVEIDPAITAIAHNYFFLDRLMAEYEEDARERLNLISDDALSYLESTDQKYDAIVNDTFDSGTPPAHLTTKHFLTAVYDHLEPGGLYLTNIVAALEGPGSSFLDAQVELLNSIFGNAHIIPCATEQFDQADNVIVVSQKR